MWVTPPTLLRDAMLAVNSYCDVRFDLAITNFASGMAVGFRAEKPKMDPIAFEVIE